MKKLNLDRVRDYFDDEVKSSPQKAIERFNNTRMFVYVMCGGGLIGNFAVTDPWSFYIDDRVGRLPYSRKAIYQSVEVIKIMAELLGYKSGSMPYLDLNFHNCGVI